MAHMALSAPFTFTAEIPAHFATTNKFRHPTGSCPSTAIIVPEEPVPLLRSAFNAIAPANHLPAELVVEVLASGAWSWWKELVDLTHICQYWRNVALGTSQLWADAVGRSALSKDHSANVAYRMPRRQVLDEFLSRSRSYPLKLGLGSMFHSILLPIKEGAVLDPSFSRIVHLSLDLRPSPVKTIAMLETIRPCMQALESLDLTPETEVYSKQLASIKLSTWNDSDHPHLHTLNISGRLFTPEIAVKSLKTLVLHHGPRTHDVFLAAVNRCAPALESLTLRSWLHPEHQTSNPQDGSTPDVQLPKLRILDVTLERDSHPLTSLLSGISFSPDTACNLVITHQLMPKYGHLIDGPHAPPSPDSMCLQLSGDIATARLHYYLHDTECLRVQATTKKTDHRRLSLTWFIGEHRIYPTVTHLAVDLDKYSGATPRLILGGIWQDYVGCFPNLCRLDLLGKSIGNSKHEMVEGFLALLRSGRRPSGAPAARRTLAYACEVSTDLNLKGPSRAIPEMVAVENNLRAELHKLEAALKTHAAKGGPRLHRLELCIISTYSHTSHPPPRVYPYMGGACQTDSKPLRQKLESENYKERFRELVDEVVFL